MDSMTDIEVVREAVKNAGLESLVPLIDSLEAELAECHEWIRNETAGHDEEARKLEAELAQAKSDLEIIRETNAEIGDAVRDMQERGAALEAELAQARNLLNEANHRRNQLGAELAAALNENDHRKRSEAEARGELARTKAERDHNARTAVDLDRQLREAREWAEATKRLNVDLLNANEELLAKVAQVRDERDAALALVGEAVDAWDEEMRGFDPDYIIRSRAALAGEGAG